METARYRLFRERMLEEEKSRKNARGRLFKVGCSNKDAEITMLTRITRETDFKSRSGTPHSHCPSN